MGLGETEMKKWGYISASAGVVLALFSFVLSILTIVVIQGSVDLTTRNNTLYFAIILLIFAVTAAVLCIVGIVKIFKANNLYLQVSANAGRKMIKNNQQEQPPQITPNSSSARNASSSSAIETLI